MKFTALLCLLLLYASGFRDVIAEDSASSVQHVNLVSEPLESDERKVKKAASRSFHNDNIPANLRELDSDWIDFSNQILNEDENLNIKDAQLARLHGLGPAEISALSSWQHKLLEISPAQGYAGNPGTENDVENREFSFWSKRSSKSSKSPKEKQNNRKGSTNREKSGLTNGQGAKLTTTSKASHKPIETGLSDEGPELYDRNLNPEPSVVPGASVVGNVGRMSRNLATQFLLRSPRENRKYDVPIIECPPAEDGMERFACPTKDRMDRYRCIDDHVLCDGFVDCPGAEDEDRQACMFYKTMKAHLDVVADALLRWVHGR